VIRRLLIWSVVLVAALGVGFGIGALTFHPPDPQLEGSIAQPSPSAGESPGSPPPSAGPHARVVPNLVGMSRKDAEAELKKLPPLYIVNPLGGQSDLVANQNPAAGSLLKGVTRIAIGVRCKPKPCAAPPEGSIMYDPCSCSFR
jgi:hypothetical protein